MDWITSSGCARNHRITRDEVECDPVVPVAATRLWRMVIRKTITLVAWYKMLYFPVGKWVVSGVFHRRYIINNILWWIMITDGQKCVWRRGREKYHTTTVEQHNRCAVTVCLFVWFDSLRPINNHSVIKGGVFLGWTSTKLGLMFLLKDTTQWRRWGSNPRPLGHESRSLPLSHCAPCGVAVSWSGWASHTTKGLN